MADEDSISLERLVTANAEQRRDCLSRMEQREETVLDLVEQAMKLTMVNARSARDAAALVKEIADEFGTPLARARACRVLVRALSYAGQYDEALAAGAHGVTIAAGAALDEEVGRIQLATMHALTEAGRLTEAIAVGESARSRFAAAGQFALAARAEINLGVVHQRRDEPAEAVACFDRAQPALRDDPLTLGHLQNNRGEALVALNEFTEAERAFTDALASFEQAGAELTAAIALGNLADLAMRCGRLDQAIRLFEQARRRFEAADSPGHLSRILAEQAEAKALIGMMDDALCEYQQAVHELDAAGLPLEASRARSGMGRVLIRLGRWSEAETALAAAATGFADLGHETARARVDLQRAEIAASRGRLDEARAIALRSRRTLDQRPVDAAAARHVLARIALERGEFELAESELTAALTTARRYLIVPLLADLLLTSGDWHQRRGAAESSHQVHAGDNARTRTRDDDQAIKCWREAIEAIERVRSTLQASRFRTAFLGERTAAHERLIAALLRRGDVNDRREAFTVAERCKCRSLSDYDDAISSIGAASIGGAAGVGSETAQRELESESRRLRTDLNGLYLRLAEDGGSHVTPAAYEQLLCAVRDTEQALRACESRLEALPGGETVTADASPRPFVADGDREHVRGGVATADAVQHVLNKGEALIEYVLVNGAYVAFVVRHDGLYVAHLTDEESIDSSMRRFRFQIDRALRPGTMASSRSGRLLTDAQRELQFLHEALLQPLTSAVGDARRLMIVPHGALHGVPFAALHDGEQYLVDAVDLRTFPNATLFLNQRRTGGAADAPRRALVIAVGDADAPQIECEAAIVCEQLGDLCVEQLLGDEASADRVGDLIEDADILHIACHGEYVRSLPHGVGLKLADRWFTPLDLDGRRLRARLVVLSACETGRSAVGRGDEQVGLLRSFLAAGAAAVLMSQWRVHDESTLEFMRLFYSMCHNAGWEAETFDAAMGQAMREVRKRFPHPAFWAAYGIAGGGRCRQ